MGGQVMVVKGPASDRSRIIILSTTEDEKKKPRTKKTVYPSMQMRYSERAA
jgi:hypothetical protein